MSSFDEDPDDSRKRILAYHSESDCYFLCWSNAEFAQCNQHGDCCDDVTGIKCHEENYKKQIQENEK